MQRYNLLIVEDDEVIATLLSLLAEKQFTTTQCASVRECRKKLEEQHIDACISDLNLPDGRGTDIARMLLDKYPTIPLFFHTAAAKDDTHELLTRHIGAFDKERIYTKPYRDYPSLFDAIYHAVATANK